MQRHCLNRHDKAYSPLPLWPHGGLEQLQATHVAETLLINRVLYFAYIKYDTSLWDNVSNGPKRHPWIICLSNGWIIIHIHYLFKWIICLSHLCKSFQSMQYSIYESTHFSSSIISSWSSILAAISNNKTDQQINTRTSFRRIFHHFYIKIFTFLHRVSHFLGVSTLSE